MLVIGSLTQYQYRKEFALYTLSGPFIKKAYRIANFLNLDCIWKAKVLP